MRRFVETNGGEAVEGGGFRAFAPGAPTARNCQLKPVAFAMEQTFHS